MVIQSGFGVEQGAVGGIHEWRAVLDAIFDYVAHVSSGSPLFVIFRVRLVVLP